MTDLQITHIGGPTILIEVGLARSLNDDQLALLTAQLLETNERNERLIEGLLVLSESDQRSLSLPPNTRGRSSAPEARIARLATMRQTHSTGRSGDGVSTCF